MKKNNESWLPHIDVFNSSGMDSYKRKYFHDGYKFAFSHIRAGMVITRLNKGMNNGIILYYDLKNG